VVTIAENLAAVREKIARAAERSGRGYEDITLVVVTKTIDVARIREAIAAGATDIGENYVQEVAAKWHEIEDAVRWHFIGHLQSNKAKDAVQMFSVIQSVDSVSLAQEIGRRASGLGKTADILIEVKLSEEATKFGVPIEDAVHLAGEVAEIPGIRLQGLMGMAPFLANPDEARPYFNRLHELWEKLPKEQRRWLSMGMSHDFETAIEEGSNMVRIGTAVFGARS
jgi:PLP dependent protein